MGDITSNERQPEGIKIILKFSQGYQVLLRGGKFVSLQGADLPELNERLSLEPDVVVYSLFDVSPERDRQSISDDEVPDLSRYYTVVVKDSGRAERLMNELNQMSFVEEAYVERPADLAI